MWLTRCVWNSLPHAFHWSLHLLAFRAWCQASVDLACLSYEPLLFDWVLCFREGYSSQVTSFAAQCVIVGERVCPSWLLLKIEYEKNSARAMLSELFKGIAFRNRSTYWSVHVVSPPYISTIKRDKDPWCHPCSSA